ncbi:MAG TPA: hypothetical protein VG056_12425 [Pirellulales bacterium]|nr:hypothetical protein [Pirellulales bacterium]
MSTFENSDYKWRETYFVLFDAAKRPSLEKIAKALRRVNPRFELSNLAGNEEGMFESLTLHSPQDYAAVDISYADDEEVQEQGINLSEELRSSATDADERAKLARLPKCNARLDILHFEQVVGAESEEEGEELLDPSALLIILDTLVDMTGGVGVDPQSGTVF